MRQLYLGSHCIFRFLLLISILLFSLNAISQGANSFDLDYVNGELFVNKKINLQGKKIFIPEGGVLKFSRKGQFLNGTLVGNKSQIKGNINSIFGNIRIEGTWNVHNLSTKMFEKTDVYTLENLSNLSSNEIFNNIYVEDDCIVPIPHFTSVFKIKSNTNVFLLADIRSLATKFKGGYALEIIGDNVLIDGNNHSIVGTIKIDKNNNQEWQHGIYIGRNSKNVQIRNVKLREFWGDGIYVMGENIVISNLESSFNGRQGLSLTHGKNIKILNSEFHHTGYIEICSCKGPGAGIDIEPNKGDTVYNIYIENCKLHDNYKYMKQYVNDFQVYNAKNSKIHVRSSEIGGIYLGTSDKIIFENCKIEDTVFGIDTKVKDVVIKKCTLTNISENINDSIELL